MRNAMLGAHPEAGSGVANHNSSSAKEESAGLAPMDVLAQDATQGDEDLDEDIVMADTEQKVWVYEISRLQTHFGGLDAPSS